MVDIEKIQEEYIKCYSDKTRIYMIEHYLKTYDATQRMEVPYILFPRQKEMCRNIEKGLSVTVLKPRQSGITTCCCSILSCNCALASPTEPVICLVIGNSLDISQQFVTKIREFLLQLPRWFFGEDYWSPDENDPKNKKSIFLVSNQKELKLFNGSRIIARSSGPDASRGVGGVTYLVFDEAAFIENGKDVYASAVATISTGGHIIMISTPNGKDQLYYETCRQARLGLNGYLLVQLKWYQDPRYNKFLEWRKKNENTGEVEVIKEPTLDEKGNIEYNEAHWEEMVQKGYKAYSPWYIKMCKQFNNNSQKIAQELDVSFLGSDSTVVAPEYIEMQEKMNVKDPDESLKDPLLEETWVWKPPYDGHRYVMGIDNSRGDSDDFTALEIIDLDGIDEESGEPIVEQVLEYYGKLTGDSIGEIGNNYGLTYSNSRGYCYIVVEDIGGYGSATILSLLNLKYPNLYYDDPSLKNYTSITDATPIKVTKDGLPGFHNNSVRFQMLSNFANLVKTNQFKVRSKRVINQLDTWIFKNGRIDHKDGCHDDALTCLSMALFVATFSMERMDRARRLDETMLKSMIRVNSRITWNPSSISNNSNNSIPSYINLDHNNSDEARDRIRRLAQNAIISSNNISSKKYSSFGSSMWVMG